MSTWLLLQLASTLLASQATPETPHSALATLAGIHTAAMAARRPVSFNETLTLAVQNNPDVAAARAVAAQAAVKASLVYSALLPKVTLEGYYIHTTAPAVLDLLKPIRTLASSLELSEEVTRNLQTNLENSLPFPTTLEIQRQNSLLGTALLQQVLFTPQLFLLPVAGESKAAATLGVREAQEKLLSAIARVYLGLEGLAGVAKAAQDAEGVAEKRVRDASLQAQLGTATNIAVLRAQQTLTQARATLATVYGQRIGLLALLEAMVGEAVRPPEGTHVQLAVTPANEASEPWNNTNAVKIAALALKRHGHFNTFERFSWLPAVVAQAKGSYNSNKSFFNTNWIFNGIIALKWDLYDSGKKRVSRIENEWKQAEFQAKLAAARRQAKAAWHAARTNLLTSQVTLEQAEATQALAVRAHAQTEAAFQEGFSTGLEVSEVDTRRFLAESAAAQARAQLQLRRIELLVSEGRLAKTMGIKTMLVE